MNDLGVDLQVRGPRVLIRPEDQSVEARRSGIIAVRHHDPDVIGTVLAVGERVCDVKAGDVVLFTPESGQTMEYGSDRLLVLYEEEILAIWDEEKAPI